MAIVLWSGFPAAAALALYYLGGLALFYRYFKRRIVDDIRPRTLMDHLACGGLLIFSVLVWPVSVPVWMGADLVGAIRNLSKQDTRNIDYEWEDK